MLICFIHRLLNHWLARLSSSSLSSHEGVELFFYFVLNSFSIFVLSCLWPSSPPFTPVPFIRPWWKTISCSRRSTRAETRSLTLALALSLVEQRGDQLTSCPYSTVREYQRIRRLSNNNKKKRANKILINFSVTVQSTSTAIGAETNHPWQDCTTASPDSKLNLNWLNNYHRDHEAPFFSFLFLRILHKQSLHNSVNYGYGTKENPHLLSLSVLVQLGRSRSSYVTLHRDKPQ